MNRHERCKAAIAAQPVDRLPAYLPSIACDVASELLGRKVHTGTGSLHYAESCAWMKGADAHAAFEHQLLEDLADLHRALNLDVFRMPWRERRRPARQVDEFTFLYGDPDGDHVICQYSPESGDFGPIRVVRATAGDYEDDVRRRVEAEERRRGERPFPSICAPAEHQAMLERFGGEFYVVCNGGGIGIGWSPDALMLLATDPDLIRRDLLLQARSAVGLGHALARLKAPIVLVAGLDLAGTGGPFYSPAAFRANMLPALKLAMDGLREVGGHYMFRSDGNLWPIADMLFGEAGCPGYGEIDRDAGMAAGALRAKFPRLVLWGNFPVSQLASRDAGWVREEARRIREESGGTACFQGPSNAIIKGTPAKNVEALFALR